jgi:glycosyltransferase involved in cell wall biosynthesis
MRLLVLPRDMNPYQELLYGEMRQLGVQVTYLACLTSSRTLNLLLLPVEVAAHRIAGVRLIHLHWVFVFALPGMRRFRVIQRIAYVWFLFWLRICRMLGMRLVWTAHNVLPHTPVFADDVSARRALVAASDLVLAHSPSALAELTALGAVVHRSAIIPHGPIAPTRSIASPEASGDDGRARRFLFFGRVQEYKGVEDLLAAFSAMPDGVAAHLTVAGQCNDPGLRARLHALADEAGERVVLRLEHVPEEEIALLFAAAEVVVLPFRRVTTSGSAILALSHGRPLIVPDLPGLADLPDRAVLRYGREIPALAAALAYLARADNAILADMSVTARSYAARTTWREIAERTIAEMISVLGDVPAADLYCRLMRKVS